MLTRVNINFKSCTTLSFGGGAKWSKMTNKWPFLNKDKPGGKWGVQLFWAF